MNYKLSMMIQKYMREAPELTDESGVVVYKPNPDVIIKIQGHNLVEREVQTVHHSAEHLIDPVIITDRGGITRATYGQLGIKFNVYTKTEVFK